MDCSLVLLNWLMQRALVWLNLYGCEAVLHKLKNRQKMHFWLCTCIIEILKANVSQKIFFFNLVCLSTKQPKNTKNAFFACFWAYVGQPHSHIGWALSMPFASITPTNPRTNPWNFGGNCSAFGGGWKTQFFWVGHFEFFFAKKKKIFHFFPMKKPWVSYEVSFFFKILMITLVSSQKSLPPNISAGSVAIVHTPSILLYTDLYYPWFCQVNPNLITQLWH